MKKSEAILISAYTGFLLTKDFADVHAFCEKTLGRPIFTHEFADVKTQQELQAKLKPEVIRLVENETNDKPVKEPEKQEILTEE